VNEQRVPRVGHGQQAIQRNRLTASLDADARTVIPRDFHGSVAGGVVDDADAHIETIRGLPDGSEARFEEKLAIPGRDPDKQLAPHDSVVPIAFRGGVDHFA